VQALNETALDLLESQFFVAPPVPPEEWKPFVGAQPKFVQRPPDRLLGPRDVDKITEIACSKIRQAILCRCSSTEKGGSGVHVVLAQDASYSDAARTLLRKAVEARTDEDGRDSSSCTTVTVSIGMDWLQLIPSKDARSMVPTSPSLDDEEEERADLLIIAGTVSKYASLVLGDSVFLKDMDAAYRDNRLAAITNNAVMLPIGTQQQNLFGVDSERVLRCVSEAVLDSVDRGIARLRFGNVAPTAGDTNNDGGSSRMLLNWAFAHLREAGSENGEDKSQQRPELLRLPKPLTMNTDEYDEDPEEEDEEEGTGSGGDNEGDDDMFSIMTTIFDHLAQFIGFQNGKSCVLYYIRPLGSELVTSHDRIFPSDLQIAFGLPSPTKSNTPTKLRVANYYDAGLCVSVLQKYVLQDHGYSLLMDRDGLAMNRDASIGHVLSKLNQNSVPAAAPTDEKAIYNYFVGDGASRLNGGAELALYLMERFYNGSNPDSSSRSATGSKSGCNTTKRCSNFSTLFIFVNESWAVEDNLIQQSGFEQHQLYNRSFYDLLASGGHGFVHMCKGQVELRRTLCQLTEMQLAYIQDSNDTPDTSTAGQLHVVLICDIELQMPPAIFPDTGTERSPEVMFLRDTLGPFSEGCARPIPIYGCSAYEYLQYTHSFLNTPEGTPDHYEYVTGMTDIQAAQMAGFDQPEGKCVLFINDVFGIHSLGETLRMNQSGIGFNRRQVTHDFC